MKDASCRDETFLHIGDTSLLEFPLMRRFDSSTALETQISTATGITRSICLGNKWQQFTASLIQQLLITDFASISLAADSW